MHESARVKVSIDYARKFIRTHGRLDFAETTVASVPIKYLSENPAKFILHEDPSNSEARVNSDMETSIIFSAIELLALLLFLWIRPRWRKWGMGT